MTRERWDELSPIVDAVLDQPAERRRGYIAEVSGGDAVLAGELTRFADSFDASTSDAGDDPIFDAAERERAALLDHRSFGTEAELRAQLQSTLGASYTIEREIGGGGMSRVFVAEETGLRRHVVIKVLPPEVTEGINAERFAREIKLAASLQQANIVPVLAAGTAAGLRFYTMPFIEGRSLRDRLSRDGPLPVADAISILRDVARALAFAHARGVIHRDIKPGNILLSDRTAVVTDFGIAKALGAARIAREDGMGDDVSRTGIVLGTPAYMAPEQAAADPKVDHRADLYSFGCMAYELFAGTPPFTADAQHEIIAAHFREKPRVLTDVRPDVPTDVARLIAACLEKNPARRPQSAGDLLLALDDAASQPVVIRSRWSRRKVLVMSSMVVFPIAAAVSYYTPRRIQPHTVTPGTTSGAAHDKYLIGQEQLKRRGSGVRGSIQSFQEAIDLDSNFALAHTALANALTFEPFFSGLLVRESLERAVREARRALALDSTLADAYMALGAAHALAGEWRQSETEMRRAIALAPRNAAARQTFARHLLVRGYVDEALDQLERAREVDPVSPLIAAWVAYAFFLNGQRDSASAESARAFQLAPTQLATANLGALVNLALGNNDAARRLIDIPVTTEMTNAPYVYAKLGDTATANRLVREMEARTPRPWYADVARASVLLATVDSSAALDALERSARDSGVLWTYFIPLGDPPYDLVRTSPRFAALVRRANLESRIITHPRDE
jgi:serine/threonine protein kinase/Flp pilus assembly protein TadD